MTASSAMIRICVRVSVSSELGSPVSSPRAALRRASTLASLRAINFFRSDISPLPWRAPKAQSHQPKTFLVGRRHVRMLGRLGNGFGWTAPGLDLLDGDGHGRSGRD